MNKECICGWDQPARLFGTDLKVPPLHTLKIAGLGEFWVQPREVFECRFGHQHVVSVNLVQMESA